MTVYVCIVAAACGGILFGFGLGWSARMRHEQTRRGGDLLDSYRPS